MILHRRNGALKVSRINSAGFSLVQVLVSMGLLAILTTIFSSVIVNMMTAQKAIETRQNIIALNNEISMLLTNGSTCLSAFGGGEQKIDVARTRSPEGFPIRLRINNEILTENSSSPLFELEVARLYLTNGTLVGTNLDANRVFAARILGQFRPTAAAQKFGGLSEFKTRLLGSIFLTLDSADKIIACSDFSPLDKNTASEFCMSVGGSYDEEKAKCELEAKPVVQEICKAVGLKFDAKNGKCDPLSGGSGSSSSGGERWVLETETIHANSGVVTGCPKHTQAKYGSKYQTNVWVSSREPKYFMRADCPLPGSRCDNAGDLCYAFEAKGIVGTHCIVKKLQCQ